MISFSCPCQNQICSGYLDPPEFPVINGQADSLLFTKLTVDVRRLVYIELFGKRTVYVSYANSEKSFRRENDLTRILPALDHCACDEGAARCLTDIPKAVIDGSIHIPYGTNTPSFVGATSLLMFRTRHVPYHRLIRTVDVYPAQDITKADTWVSTFTGFTNALQVTLNYPQLSTVRIVIIPSRAGKPRAVLWMLQSACMWAKRNFRENETAIKLFLPIEVAEMARADAKINAMEILQISSMKIIYTFERQIFANSRTNVRSSEVQGTDGVGDIPVGGTQVGGTQVGGTQVAETDVGGTWEEDSC
ncbi:hypothetical protein G7046_g6888 [Stylonectria norvegica]|nr:hypothetical protein G7046_g6888 [Stylonectria norvegica]